MKELTIALLMWITSNTPLAYDGSHAPEVIHVPQKQLVQILFEGNVARGVDSERVSVAGLYNFRDGKVYLLDDVDLDTVEGKAVLVHELVHYLQYYHGIDQTVECMRKLEGQAYEVQANYLTAHGKESPFSGLHVLMVSNCWPMNL